MNFQPGDRLRYVGPNKYLKGWVLEVTGPYREDTMHWDCKWIETPGTTLSHGGECYVADDTALCDCRGTVVFERIDSPPTEEPRDGK